MPAESGVDQADAAGILEHRLIWNKPIPSTHITVDAFLVARHGAHAIGVIGDGGGVGIGGLGVKRECLSQHADGERETGDINIVPLHGYILHLCLT